MENQSRRNFLKCSMSFGAAALAAGLPAPLMASDADEPDARMAFGLVTYQWGTNWNLPSLIRYCTAAKVLGVELRTTHAHGVEPSLGQKQRAEVKKRFDESAVTLVGLGSAECFDHPDPQALKQAIETTKGFIKLSHDVGGSGVKVRPNDFHKNVPREKTIEQIGKSLNEVGTFGADYGQQIRLEVHGQCCELPIIKKIMDIADNPNVAVCWNSNPPDLKGKGLEYNFNLVKDRFGSTAHVRALNTRGYPWQKLINLFVKMDYHGWLLLEAPGEPKNPIEALVKQRKLFEQMVAQARAAV